MLADIHVGILGFSYQYGFLPAPTLQKGDRPQQDSDQIHAAGY